MINGEFQQGDRVIGQKYEFKDTKGTVVTQFNEVVVLVNFDNFPMVVATTFNNLKEITDEDGVN